MADQHRMRTMETVLAMSSLFDKGKSMRDHFRDLDNRMKKAKAPVKAKRGSGNDAESRKRDYEHTIRELSKLNVLLGAK